MQQLREELPHIPWLHDISKTFRTLARLPDASGNGSAGASEIPANRRALIDKWRAHARTLDKPVALNEVDSKSILAAYGVASPAEIIVKTSEEAAAAAEKLGFPVVIKAVSAEIAHKSDAGLVKLGIADATQARNAADEMTSTCARLGVRLEGILVAQQVKGGIEMVAGIHRDPEMGPVVMAGLGGVWLELFKDVAFAPPWLDRDAALEAIATTRAATLLAGYRGAPAADAAALADVMVSLGALSREFGDIMESVDVNPLLVREKGKGAVALDGLVVLRPPAANA